MRITSVQNHYYNSFGGSIHSKASETSFGSLKLKNNENDFSDTCFYRDIPTLLKTSNLLKTEFPSGTIIMDFAGSNGEEAISLYSILNNSGLDKYKIYSYDKSAKAVELGKKGIYTVFSAKTNDYFLLPESKYSKALPENHEMINLLRKCFNAVMEPVLKPEHTINDPVYLSKLSNFPDFQVKYFKLKDTHKNKIKIEQGDINNIENILPEKKAGAILFRNAFYIETGNYGINEFSIFEDLNINKKQIIENIVDKVHKKLLPGGFFIVGDIEKEHIYIADNHVKDKDKYFIRNYGAAICKEPLLWSVLEKDGRFEPVFYKKVDSPCAFRENMKIPTIWRKK